LETPPANDLPLFFPRDLLVTMRPNSLRRFTGIPDSATLSEARTCVRGGGTLIFPTDTVYGIGCDPADSTAVAAVFAAKRRPPDKPLALHVANSADALPFVTQLTPAALTVMEKLMPGPLAIVVRRNPEFAAAAVGGAATISVRCPDDDACRAILSATGPLAATSANISGMTPYDGSSYDLDRLPDATLALVKGPTRWRRESTVLDCTAAAAKILRSGALSADVIRSALAGIAELES
jgi:L-threonylcarbamoyladenylate synthase